MSRAGPECLYQAAPQAGTVTVCTDHGRSGSTAGGCVADQRWGLWASRWGAHFRMDHRCAAFPTGRLSSVPRVPLRDTEADAAPWKAAPAFNGRQRG